MRTLLLPLLLLLLPSCVLAQAPIDPLVRPDEVYTWNLSLSYIPQGQEGFGVDEHGRYFTYTLFSEERSLSVSGTLKLDERWRVGMGFTHNQWAVQETREYGGEQENLSRTGGDFALSLTGEYRLDPGSLLDPRLSHALGYPRSGIEVSASLLQDPVVLVGAVGYEFLLENPRQWMILSLGAGFVANRQVSFSATASYTLPIGGAGLPTTSISLLTRYSLDLRSKREVGVRASVNLRGEVVWMGLEVGLAGRGP